MNSKRFSFFLIIIVLIFSGQQVLAQQKKITLDHIYRSYTFSPKSVRGINSMNDGKHYTINNRGTSIDKHRYKDGKKTGTIFSVEDFDTLTSFRSYEFSPDEEFILLTTEVEPIYRRSYLAEYYIYHTATGELRPLSSNGKQQLASLSPDNSKIAFVRNNNIFITDLKENTEQQITFDGKKNEVINGSPDWVYEEEFGFADGFKWSPDGKRIAFYKFDETHVKEFFMSTYGSLYPEEYRFKYPKAGERNSDVTVHVYDLASGETEMLDIPGDEDFYIPRIKWTNDPEQLSIIWLNRLQNHVKVLHFDATNGSYVTAYEEKNDKYISEATDDMVTYLDDNASFLLISERDGYFHLYHHNFIHGETRPVTSGQYDVHSLVGVNKTKGIVYYMSYEASPTEIHLYSVKLDGSGKKKISEAPGSYTANFSATFDYYILSHSDANTPAVYKLYNKKGKMIRVLEDNEALKKTTEAFGFTDVEFMKVPTKSGQELNGYMIKPADFDPSREYPLFIYVYGGPESQNVVDRWNRNAAWFQMLVQEGYIVACVDNRGTNGRGEAFRKSTYQQLGKLETIDQLEAATYLGDLTYIDKDRIGIFGWSYGGFMTSLCLTKGNGLFRMGIAVAPVTNWRYYDTIYTERFMRTPQENPGGYDDNSPINFADQLEGKLLLVHGMSDDNVHFQNSVDFVTALVEADKQFEMLFYPNKNHGIYGGNTTFHLYTKMTAFILENL
ncbi:MAG: S9 family peptidase [Bacteroidales bacterium]|nr:S9 family peptidase [Bacteroidales bacterium]